MDMHSGGDQKENFATCYIEAPEAEARVIFYNRFGHNPDRITCDCCGPDYSYYDYDSLAEASGYDRGCRSVKIDGYWTYLEEGDSERSWQKYMTLEAYCKLDSVLIIRADEISDEERVGDSCIARRMP